MVSQKLNLVLFNFPTKTLNICNFYTNATLKMGVHLKVIKLHPLHSPPFLKVCFILNRLSWPHGPFHSTISRKPNVRVITNYKQIQFNLQKYILLFVYDAIHEVIIEKYFKLFSVFIQLFHDYNNLNHVVSFSGDQVVTLVTGDLGIK